LEVFFLLPRGERLRFFNDEKKFIVISIHAPVWGATFLKKQKQMGQIHFNPRSRVGSDGQGNVRQLHGQDFNPRSRVGSDILLQL